MSEMIVESPPIPWRTEDAAGVEVSQIPTQGRVWFENGAMADDVDEARWWVFGHGNGNRLRITRLRSGDTYRYIFPTGAVVACTGDRHLDCEPGQCAAVATLAIAEVRPCP